MDKSILLWINPFYYGNNIKFKIIISQIQILTPLHEVLLKLETLATY